MTMACMIDLWQLRSTSTTSPRRTAEWKTILLAVEVPFVTNMVRSAPKMWAAAASASPTGPLCSISEPNSATETDRSLRRVFSPKNSWNAEPTADLRNAVPPLCPGVCQE